MEHEETKMYPSTLALMILSNPNVGHENINVCPSLVNQTTFLGIVVID